MEIVKDELADAITENRETGEKLKDQIDITSRELKD